MLFGGSAMRCQIAFNRTIVELKLLYRFRQLVRVRAFNRTIVELKHNIRNL